MFINKPDNLIRQLKRSTAVILVPFVIIGVCLFPVSAESILNASLTKVNAWQEGSIYRTQYSLSIVNDGSDSVLGWTVKLSVPEGSYMNSSDGWNGSYSIRDEILTIIPLSYNQEIQPGHTVSDIGFILIPESSLILAPLFSEMNLITSSV